MSGAERKKADADERAHKAGIAAEEEAAMRRPVQQLPDFIGVGGVSRPDPFRAAALEAISAEMGLPPGIIDLMARRRGRDAEKEGRREAMGKQGLFEVNGECKTSDEVRSHLLVERAAGRLRFPESAD